MPPLGLSSPSRRMTARSSNGRKSMICFQSICPTCSRAIALALGGSPTPKSNVVIVGTRYKGVLTRSPEHSRPGQGDLRTYRATPRCEHFEAGVGENAAAPTDAGAGIPPPKGRRRCKVRGLLLRRTRMAKGCRGRLFIEWRCPPPLPERRRTAASPSRRPPKADPQARAVSGRNPCEPEFVGSGLGFFSVSSIKRHPQSKKFSGTY